jgi:hypothetical protein
VRFAAKRKTQNVGSTSSAASETGNKNPTKQKRDAEKETSGESSSEEDSSSEESDEEEVASLSDEVTNENESLAAKGTVPNGLSFNNDDDKDDELFVKKKGLSSEETISVTPVNEESLQDEVICSVT